MITNKFVNIVEARVFSMFAWKRARTPVMDATIPGLSCPTAVRTSLFCSRVIEGHLKPKFAAPVLKLLPQLLIVGHVLGDVNKEG